jgi:hypothetical protein
MVGYLPRAERARGTIGSFSDRSRKLGGLTTFRHADHRFGRKSSLSTKNTRPDDRIRNDMRLLPRRVPSPASGGGALPEDAITSGTKASPLSLRLRLESIAAYDSCGRNSYLIRTTAPRESTPAHSAKLMLVPDFPSLTIKPESPRTRGERYLNQTYCSRQRRGAGETQSANSR